MRVPATNLIGEENRGWYVATTTLDFERSGIHRVIGGLLLLEDVIAYCKQAPSRRPGYKTLWDVPLIRNRLADFKIQYEVGRILSYRVGWMQSRQMVPNYEASIAKIFGTELRQRVAAFAINTLGPVRPGHVRRIRAAGRARGLRLPAERLADHRRRYV